MVFAVTFLIDVIIQAFALFFIFYLWWNAQSKLKMDVFLEIEICSLDKKGDK